MNGWLRAAGAVWLLASACSGSTGEGGATGDHHTGGETDPARSPYAASPLTPLADEMTALALAVCAEREPPAVRFPLAESGGAGQRLSLVDGAPTDPLAPLAFLVQLDVELTTELRDPRWVRISWLLTRSGLHPVAVAPRGVGRHAPARPFGELGQLGEMVTDLIGRTDDSVPAAIADADRERLGPELVDALEQLRELPAPEDPLPAERIERVAFGDLAVLVRDAHRRRFLLDMAVDATDTGFRVRSDPIVTVSPLDTPEPHAR